LFLWLLFNIVILAAWTIAGHRAAAAADNQQKTGG